MSTGMNNGHEAAPIVNGGVMFVSTSYNQVLALEAKTGNLLWRYQSPVPGNLRGKPVSRGVAVFGDKVFFCLGEASLVALDARDRQGNLADGGRHEQHRRVHDGAAARRGRQTGRRHLRRRRPESRIRRGVRSRERDGRLWQTFTIPAPGEPGSETWRGEDWKTGGGATWMTGNYDPATNTVFWGTGNGFPWVGAARPGDNLYTASTLAIDVATGAIKGHFQYTPNESWDWDEVSPPILIDYRRGGRTIKGLVNFARNGYLYFLERTAGGIKFVEGMPYVKQNVFKSLDPITGRPDVDPARKPEVGKVADFCPSWSGAKTGNPARTAPRRAWSTCPPRRTSAR